MCVCVLEAYFMNSHPYTVVLVMDTSLPVEAQWTNERLHKERAGASLRCAHEYLAGIRRLRMNHTIS